MAELHLGSDTPTLRQAGPTLVTPRGGDPAPVSAPENVAGARQAAALLDVVLEHTGVGVAFLDPDLRYVRINEVLAEANGLPVAAHLGRTVAEVLPDVAPHVEPLLRRVLSTGEPVLDLRLRTGPTPGQPGRPRTWTVSYHRIESGDAAASQGGDRDTRVEGVALIVRDDTDLVEAEDERRRLVDAGHEAAQRVAAAVLEATRAAEGAAEAARRQTLLQRLTAGLAPAMTREEIADVVGSLAAGLLGASVAAILEYDGVGHLLRLVPPQGAPSRISAEPLDLDRFPAAREAVTQRRPVCFASRAERDARFPEMARLPIPQAAWATLPLVSRGRVLGLVTVGWDDEHVVDDEELALLEALAAQCTIALERLHLYESAQDARDAAEGARARLDVIAGAGEALGASLDEAEVLQRLGSLLVPGLTDWLMVMLPDGRGRLAPRLSFHADADLAWASRQVLNGPAFPVDSPIPPAVVFRTREPLLVADLAEQVRLGHVPEPIADAAMAVDPGPAMLVPMVARGRTVGVLSLVDGRSRAQHGGHLHALQDLVADIARRAAMALDNARLFGQRSRIATRLQDSLLPPRLPDVPGAVVAARYATAEEAVEVGGDFYDVIALPGGCRLLVIGDVSGRGVEAAGTTGLARHTLRALARDTSPGQALTRLNDVLLDQADAEGAGERFLTAVAARYERDGDGALLHVARAGHPPAVLARADGTTSLVRPDGPLLGVLRPVEVGEAVVRLGPGDCFLLFTDGITEARRGEELFGEARLADAVSACVRRPGFGTPTSDGDGGERTGADQLADAVLDAVTAFESAPGGDDRALLVLHVPRRPMSVPSG